MDYYAIDWGFNRLITNVVAIKMLFKKQPIRIPLTSIELIRLLPKRRKDLRSQY